jgi:hypothetical protein
LKGENDVIPTLTMAYENYGVARRRKKQSQYAGLWPEILSTKL